MRSLTWLDADNVVVNERDLAKLVSCVFLNAIKFTEEGEISLMANVTSKGNVIVINVVDTGPGIPKAFLPSLFKPFSREDDSLTRQKEGLGLGLLVAKGLARKVGGDLACVRSDTDGPRRGSEFELHVPLSFTDSTSRGSGPNCTSTPARCSASEPASKVRDRQTSSVDRRRGPRNHPSRTATRTPETTLLPKANTPLAPSSQSRRNSLSQPITSTPSRQPSRKKAPTFDRHLAKKHPLTFLVAEDNPIIRKLVVTMLSNLGYTGVHEAYDGVEAVNQMTIDRKLRGEKPIDVILMDLWMPNMDGYQACQKIFAMEREQRERSAKQRKRSAGIELADYDDMARRKQGGVTVLAVSADVTDEAFDKAREVGMHGFMMKPYKIADLERLILEHCTGDSKEHS